MFTLIAQNFREKSLVVNTSSPVPHVDYHSITEGESKQLLFSCLLATNRQIAIHQIVVVIDL